MDIKLIETGNGGELAKKTKDLFVIHGFENMPYLALFGGNVEASTPSKRVANEQAFDWWGNALLAPNSPERQMNSLTERTLNNTALTSSGRILIENAVKRDVAFMKPFAKVDVSVTILDFHRVKILLLIKEPSNLQRKEFVYIWDATRKELDIPYDASNPPIPGVSGFDYFLDFDVA
jgi:hypothetical protein